MDRTFIDKLDVLICKFIKIATDLSNKLNYTVKFIGISDVKSDMITGNFLFQYGYPVADNIQQIDIPIEKFYNVDNIVKEIIDNLPR